MKLSPNVKIKIIIISVDIEVQILKTCLRCIPILLDSKGTNI